MANFGTNLTDRPSTLPSLLVPCWWRMRTRITTPCWWRNLVARLLVLLHERRSSTGRLLVLVLLHERRSSTARARGVMNHVLGFCAHLGSPSFDSLFSVE
jgi:hypothetical protein